MGEWGGEGRQGTKHHVQYVLFPYAAMCVQRGKHTDTYLRVYVSNISARTREMKSLDASAESLGGWWHKGPISLANSSII